MSKDFEWVTPEGKGILGHLDDDGVVTFVVEAGSGSSVRGTEFFNAMMDSFGEDAKAIHGVWLKGPQGRPSTNIDKVNELTDKGMPLEEAIQHAWTVTRARKRGFGPAQLLGIPQGHPGVYTRVDVLVQRLIVETTTSDDSNPSIS